MAELAPLLPLILDNVEIPEGVPSPELTELQSGIIQALRESDQIEWSDEAIRVTAYIIAKKALYGVTYDSYTESLMPALLQLISQKS